MTERVSPIPLQSLSYAASRASLYQRGLFLQQIYGSLFDGKVKDCRLPTVPKHWYISLKLKSIFFVGPKKKLKSSNRFPSLYYHQFSSSFTPETINLVHITCQISRFNFSQEKSDKKGKCWWIFQSLSDFLDIVFVERGILTEGMY